jgi:squalene-associated FAD-dependent desaturase
MPSQSVLVIGGGLAGMACAVALAEAGIRVRLFEKKPHLGGRATSYTLPDGSEVDNCQHLTLGCCTNLADFFRRVGADKKIRTYDRLYMQDGRGRRATLKSGMFPPPLHMAPSMAFFGSLSLADKRGIAKALMTVARAGGAPPGIDNISMLDWLRRMNQTPEAIAKFWRVVLVSALDEELDRAEARYGIDVFWKTFLANREGSLIGLPSVPLAELYGGCGPAIARQGGEVKLRSGMREIRIQDGRFAGAVAEDGTPLEADACVLAVPYDTLSQMLPAAMFELGGPLAGLRELRTSPITSVHLWYDRSVMQQPYLALMDYTTQWIFNKTSLYASNAGSESTNGSGPHAQAAAAKTQYLQLVISASYDLVQQSRQQIIELCTKELAEILPATREAKLVKSTVIKEVHATFSPSPGVDRLRPSQESGVANLFFAGDFTRTGWPSTMEGAVRSGYLAAEAALKAFGQPRKFLQPDLPLEGLSKHWAARAARVLHS